MRLLRNAVLLPMFLLTLSAGCGQTKIIEKPVPVEIPVYETIPIPAELLETTGKAQIPAEITYGQALKLWARDRATIDVLSGNIESIRLLNEE